ncbi:ScbA/BarX family gamma-butyrolactone biosynthesis protein [Streptomyces tirandamycinicus]|uniref:ScbA/BarX family gamma-butyrolactone biosynthesis protein n=1 Tax=Streptomyces TaxID=1883 RepID=UPI00039EDD4E|nr:MULTISPECIES: ScbA/BarX family gamma-butyrolactone biosynthesis protein [Streptomyces]MCY0985328.1 ScbA/BarX family gamma-butyrolactone biosynthesis protein [Streptomyces tirandamycinicus]
MPTITELAARPALTTTVAREYVHRAALSEVFLTGWNEAGRDAFTVTAQLPRCHTFYVPEYGMYDPLLLCEMIRQSSTLLTHVAYQVPFGHQLSWSRLQFAVNPQAMRIEDTPADVELHVTCSDIRYHRSLPVTMSMHLEAVRNGSLLAMASVRFGSHSPAVYQRLRPGRGDIDEIFASAPKPPEPVSRSTVGRLRKQDIVLSPATEPLRWQLRVDTSHPVLFDHALDHVPGMLLLESVRQAGQAVRPSRAGAVLPVSMDVSFNHYVEFDEPCWIEAEPTDAPSSSGTRRTIRVNALQKDSFAFNATAELADIDSF